MSPEASSVERNSSIEIETWCGTVHIDGRRCGRRLGPWLLRDGYSRPSLRLVTAPKRPRQGRRPSVWRPTGDVWSPADDPVRVERCFQPSDLSHDTYRPNRWWAVCPGCGADTVVRESTMVRLVREAAERGEAVLYI
jgi:hypothetical protein